VNPTDDLNGTNSAVIQAMLAHAGGFPEMVTILFVAGVVCAWIGMDRLSGTGFRRMPRWIGFAMLAAAPLIVAAGVRLPQLIWPTSPALSGQFVSIDPALP
jgi:predicted benzoate:H+ symporter BenE